MKFRLHAWDKNLFHIVGKTIDGDPWASTMDESWKKFCTVLEELSSCSKVRTHAFVLMSNHCHWLGYVSARRMKRTVPWLQQILNYELKDSHIAPPALFPINHIAQYQMTYKYIYRNPIEAHVAAKVEDYKYSTLPYVLGKSGLPFACFDHMNVIHTTGKTLRWLNQEEFIDLSR